MPLSLLQRALQRMAILFGEIHHLRHLGFRNFIGEYTADADPLLVDMQHHLRGLIGVHLEKAFENMHDKFHRRIIVVEQQHFILARLLRLWAGTRGEADTGRARIIMIILASHRNRHVLKIG
jgi:hypothetical protein